MFFAACGAGILISLVVRPAHQGFVLVCLGCVAAVAAVAAGAQVLLSGEVFTRSLWSLPGLTTLTLRLDPLSAAFVLVAGLVLFPASIYAGGELRRESFRGHERGVHSAASGAVCVGVLILIAGDALLFLLAWEIMSILCYLLVVTRPRQGGRPARVGVSAARDGRGRHACGGSWLPRARGRCEFAGNSTRSNRLHRLWAQTRAGACFSSPSSDSA